MRKLQYKLMYICSSYPNLILTSENIITIFPNLFFKTKNYRYGYDLMS